MANKLKNIIRELKWYPSVTIFFIILTSAAFFLQPENAVEKYGMALPLLKSEPWRLLTSHFIHGGMTHFFSNLIGLLFFGTILEQAGVEKKMIVLGILFAIFTTSLFTVYSQIFRYAIFSSGFPLVVGFSGVVYGLIGLMSSLVGRKAILAFVALFFLFDILMMRTNIAWSAHIGGLVGGLVIGKRIRN